MEKEIDTFEYIDHIMMDGCTKRKIKGDKAIYTLEAKEGKITIHQSIKDLVYTFVEIEEKINEVPSITLSTFSINFNNKGNIVSCVKKYSGTPVALESVGIITKFRIKGLEGICRMERFKNVELASINANCGRDWDVLNKDQENYFKKIEFYGTL